MQQLVGQAVAFTSSYPGRSNSLINEVHIVEAFDPTNSPNLTPKTFKAIWDTGATNSVITENVINQCGLKPSGKATVHTAQGTHDTDTFLVGILLPNKVAIPSIKVSKGVVASGDVLIGMDIIGTGDFAVTNKDGKTVFSFRMPSLACIDFVRNPTYQPPAVKSSPSVSRNAKCPCGSDKKYKRCCGS